jgi:hypothetical protein
MFITVAATRWREYSLGFTLCSGAQHHHWLRIEAKSTVSFSGTKHGTQHTGMIPAPAEIPQLAWLVGYLTRHKTGLSRQSSNAIRTPYSQTVSQNAIHCKPRVNLKFSVYMLTLLWAVKERRALVQINAFCAPCPTAERIRQPTGTFCLRWHASTGRMYSRSCHET